MGARGSTVRRQRNNIATGLAFEAREAVCRLLVEGRPYAEIRAEIARHAPQLRIHNSSLAAYQKSQEFQDYLAARRQWDEKLGKRRWAAGLINEGKGPQSIADLAELAILEQLHDLAAGGALETGKDVANVARAITAMQRTQLARSEAEWKRRLAEAEAKARDEERDRLAADQEKAAAEAAKVGKDAGITPETLDKIRQIYGIRKEAAA
jgi:hypothetical protein